MERPVLPRGRALAATRGIADSDAERGRNCPHIESRIETCFTFPPFSRCRIPGDLQCCTRESKETEVRQTRVTAGEPVRIIRAIGVADRNYGYGVFQERQGDAESQDARVPFLTAGRTTMATDKETRQVMEIASTPRRETRKHAVVAESRTKYGSRPACSRRAGR